MNWFKKMIRKFLEIEKDDNSTLHNIRALNTHDEEVFINKIWYRGSGYELEQVYSSIEEISGNKRFWGSKGAKIRKIHTGLPAMIVDTLADIVVDNLNQVKVPARQQEWDDIAKENDFKELLKKAIVSVLWGGDGAFKWSYDSTISEYPIIEFFPADRVEYTYERGKLTEVIFKTQKIIKGKRYILLETYAKEYIDYKLVNEEGNEVDINILEGNYTPIINNANFLLAKKFLLRNDYKHEGRGKSAFSNKLDNFDAFDEVWSQWMLAIRKGQMKTYIPDSLLPRSETTGAVRRLNDFENEFITLETDMTDDARNQVQTTQGQIQYEALLSTYITALDQCLTGLISPSTLGIDTKKLDNAEAQREKEKTTLYKVNQIIDVLKDVIADVVNITFRFVDALEGKSYEDIDVDVVFTSYANPSFEAKVETMAAANQGGIMSIETQVDQLWGDNKTQDWKDEEVKRIKEQSGIMNLEEPAINKDNVLLKEEQLKDAPDEEDEEDTKEEVEESKEKEADEEVKGN